MIVDEPTTGQDYITSRKIMNLLKDLNNRLGITVIVISHDISLVSEYCERILVMKDGKILLDGTPYEIFAYSNIDMLENMALEPPGTVKLVKEIKDAYGM